MKVLFASAEATPLAKVGGLADVVGALPIALHRIGVDVRIIMPRYERLGGSPRLKLFIDDVAVPFGDRVEHCKVFEARLPGSEVKVFLVEHYGYLSRGPVYDERGPNADRANLIRFLFFSRAVTAALPLIGWSPDIIHCHDWHTGIIPALLAGQPNPFPFQTVFTIHNLAHQGGWNADEVLRLLRLDAAPAALAPRDVRGDLNLLQLGIRQANVVNTVSPRYAEEILTSEFGFGLEADLQARRDVLVGILNGIDVERFDPANDPALRVHYQAETLDRKIENKLALQEESGFDRDARRPSFGFIGRLTAQKGVDLVLAAAPKLLARQVQLVFLGAGEPAVEESVRRLAAAHPGRVYARIGFDDAFARQIYAGADCFLMPSRFEPCGIGQMIAMRYGTPVIARATGGLRDTVIDIDAAPSAGTGFTFEPYDASAFTATALRALARFSRPSAWPELQRRCLAQDWSWERSAREYLHLYERTWRTV